MRNNDQTIFGMFHQLYIFMAHKIVVQIFFLDFFPCMLRKGRHAKKGEACEERGGMRRIWRYAEKCVA